MRCESSLADARKRDAASATGGTIDQWRASLRLVQEGERAVEQVARFKINEGEVVAQIFEDEAVIIHLGAGLFYSTEGVGRHVWRLISDGHAQSEVTQCVASAYSIDLDRVSADLQVLTDAFLEHHLVIPRSDAPDSLPELDAAGQEYTTPELQVHSDIGHLLALDPPLRGLQDNLGKKPPKAPGG